MKRRLGQHPDAALGAVLVAIGLALPLIVTSRHWHTTLINILLFLIVSVSLRFIYLSGQLSFAHGAFMGIGAYLAGMGSKWLHLPAAATFVLGAVGAMVLGIITGYPFSRLRALYYGMATVFLGLGIVLFISTGGVWTGGATGLSGIAGVFHGATRYYYFFLGLTTVSLLIMHRLEFSRIGTNFKAIAQSHLVAGSIGINERQCRIVAVAIGCFFAGLAGAGYAHYNQILSPKSFDLTATLWILMYVLIGGIGSFWGPIVGTIILLLIPEFFRKLGIYSPYVSGAVLLLVVYLLPQGLVGIPSLIRRLLAARESEALVIAGVPEAPLAAETVTDGKESDQ